VEHGGQGELDSGKKYVIGNRVYHILLLDAAVSAGCAGPVPRSPGRETAKTVSQCPSKSPKRQPLREKSIETDFLNN
jgi:hypothetical protein